MPTDAAGLIAAANAALEPGFVFAPAQAVKEFGGTTLAHPDEARVLTRGRLSLVRSPSDIGADIAGKLGDRVAWRWALPRDTAPFPKIGDWVLHPDGRTFEILSAAKGDTLAVGMGAEV